MNTPEYNHKYYMEHIDDLQMKHRQNNNNRGEEARMRARRMAKILRDSRILAGLCVKCGKNLPVKGRKACAECQAKMREKYTHHDNKTAYTELKEKRNKLYQAGICRICGNPLDTKPDGTFYKTCAKCREKDSINGRTKRKNMIEAGICTYCKKSKAVEGRKLCEACREKARMRYMARKA